MYTHSSVYAQAHITRFLNKYIVYKYIFDLAANKHLYSLYVVENSLFFKVYLEIKIINKSYKYNIV